MPNILSVSQATTAIKDVLETEFPFLWVRGEVSGVSRPPSGHIYFTLTDGACNMPVVWFKSSQWAPDKGEDCVHPMTGEVMDECEELKLKDGQEVLCAGRIGVYEPRGVYQLIAEVVQSQGAGDLQIAFEAMKKKLADAGYFDEARKKPIPASPERVAVITSPTGAVIKDFIRIAGERGTGAKIRVYPSLVQGNQAPGQIAAALKQADEDDWAEVVVLIRGGGSLEDLWAFNTEEVADALFAMQMPVVCGVGHEPDVSIADYVSDLRVATPSHAAQQLWPRRELLMQRVDELSQRLISGMNDLLEDRTDELVSLQRGLQWFSPVSRLKRLAEGFEREAKRLGLAGARFIGEKGSDLRDNQDRLHRAFGPQALDAHQSKLSMLITGLSRVASAHVSRHASKLELASVKLAALNPHAPLRRGYSMLKLGDKVISSIHEVNPGDMVNVQVRDGAVNAEVKGTEESS